MTRFEVC